MKKAQSIRMEFYLTKYNKRDVVVSYAYITYEDGTKEKVSTINPVNNSLILPAWKTDLKLKISNYNDFMNNKKQWRKEKRYLLKKDVIKSLDSETVNFEEDIIEKVKEVYVSRIKENDIDLAVVDIYTSTGKVETYSCPYKELEYVLSQKIYNYDKLVKKNKIYITDEYADLDKELNAKVDEIESLHFYLGSGYDNDEAYVIYNKKQDDGTNYERISLRKAEKLAQNKNIKVTYQLYPSFSLVSRDEFEKIYNEHKNQYYNGGNNTNKNDDLKKDTPKVSSDEKNVKDEKRVTKIVLYRFIGEGNQEFKQAILFYNDGTVKNVGLDVASLEMVKEAKRLKLKSVRKLLSYKFVVATTGSELIENWDKYMESAREKKLPAIIHPTAFNKEKKNIRPLPSINGSQKKDPNNEKDDSEIEDKKVVNTKSHDTKEEKQKVSIFTKIKNKIKKHWKKLVAFVTGGVVAIGIAIGLYNDKKNIKDYEDKNSKEDSQNDSNNRQIINDDTREIISCKTTEDVLKALENKNNVRYNFISNTGKSLVGYNVRVANDFIEGDKGTKLAHTYDEIVSEYLMYNDIEANDIQAIFGNDILDSPLLKAEFRYAIKQDALAHNIQSKNLFKANMFTSQEGFDFYNKYDTLFTEMNSNDSKEVKQEYMINFYDMVRKDFSGIDNNYENIESYKLSVLEFIEAMKNMNITVDNQFNKEENDYFEGLYDQIIDKKIDEIVKIQNSNYYVSRAYGEEDNLPQVSNYRDLITEELYKMDDYNIELQDVDVSNYDSYNINTNGVVIEKEETEEKEVKEEDKDIQDTKVNDDSSLNYTEQQVPVYDNSDYVDDSDDTLDSNYISDQDITDSVAPQDQEIALDDILDQVILPDRSSDEIVDDKEDSTSKDDILEYEIALDDYLESEEESYQVDDTVVTYNDGVVLEDGTLMNTYKDETLDGSGAVMPDAELPDPNNEEIVDSIINDMVTNPTMNDGAPKVLNLK